MKQFEYDLTYIWDYLDTLTEPYYPHKSSILKAIRLCSYDDMKVVILGLDPYHTPNVATGLCFDSNPPQPSLKNILKEIGPNAIWGEELAKQGVLLLNTALTVSKGKPGSHTELWRPFTEQFIIYLNNKDDLAWMLWGNNARSYKKLITNKTHYILEAGHPSPLNTTSKFIGCGHFIKCNEFLKSKGLEAIKWTK